MSSQIAALQSELIRVYNEAIKSSAKVTEVVKQLTRIEKKYNEATELKERIETIKGIVPAGKKNREIKTTMQEYKKLIDELTTQGAANENLTANEMKTDDAVESKTANDAILDDDDTSDPIGSIDDPVMGDIDVSATIKADIEARAERKKYRDELRKQKPTPMSMDDAVALTLPCVKLEKNPFIVGYKAKDIEKKERECKSQYARYKMHDDDYFYTSPGIQGERNMIKLMFEELGYNHTDHKRIMRRIIQSNELIDYPISAEAIIINRCPGIVVMDYDTTGTDEERAKCRDDFINTLPKDGLVAHSTTSFGAHVIVLMSDWFKMKWVEAYGDRKNHLTFEMDNGCELELFACFNEESFTTTMFPRTGRYTYAPDYKVATAQSTKTGKIGTYEWLIGDMDTMLTVAIEDVLEAAGLLDFVLANMAAAKSIREEQEADYGDDDKEADVASKELSLKLIEGIPLIKLHRQRRNKLNKEYNVSDLDLMIRGLDESTREAAWNKALLSANTSEKARLSITAEDYLVYQHPGNWRFLSNVIQSYDEKYWSEEILPFRPDAMKLLNKTQKDTKVFDFEVQQLLVDALNRIDTLIYEDKPDDEVDEHGKKVFHLTLELLCKVISSVDQRLQPSAKSICCNLWLKKNDHVFRHDEDWSDEEMKIELQGVFLKKMKQNAGKTVGHRTLQRIIKNFAPTYYKEHILPALDQFQLQKIDYRSKYTFNDFKREAAHHKYNRLDDAATSLSKLFRYCAIGREYYIEKDYDVVNKTWKPKFMTPASVEEKLRKCKLFTTTNPETGKQKEYTAWHALDKYSAEMLIDGVDFMDNGNEFIHPIFCGYKWALLDEEITKDDDMLKWWFDLVDNIICDGDPKLADYTHNWIATLLQQPGRPQKVSLIIKSPGEGTGKGTFTDILSTLVTYAVPNLSKIDSIVGKNNSIIEFKMLVVCNELKSAAGAYITDIECLKSYISDMFVQIGQKYEPDRMSRNVTAYIFISNNTKPLIIKPGNRRYVVYNVNPKYMQDTDYFSHFQNLSDEFYNRLFTYYMKKDVSKFNRFRLPRTQAKDDITEASLHPFEEWIMKKADALFDERGYTYKELNAMYDDESIEFRSKYRFEDFKAFVADRCCIYRNTKRSAKLDPSRPYIYKLKPEYKKMYEQTSFANEWTKEKPVTKESRKIKLNSAKEDMLLEIEKLKQLIAQVEQEEKLIDDDEWVKPVVDIE